MPLEKLSPEIIGRILAGGAGVCREAGIPVAGGHSIDVLEPIYGLVALGLVDPQEVKTNASARSGDVLLLSKPLGIGVLSAGIKRSLLVPADYAEMLRWTTMLNRVGAQLAGLPGVHAMTDVTGFGLAGHLLEICRASRVAAELAAGALPIIDSARALAESGVATGASTRNWASYGEAVELPAGAPASLQTLLTDPQTSGGLLIACAPASVAEVQAAVREVQGNEAWIVGRLVDGAARITVD
ncbi:MAG: selenide, water dikinase SelD, partial [Gammaproteobacteria bacterium]